MCFATFHLNPEINSRYQTINDFNQQNAIVQEATKTLQVDYYDDHHHHISYSHPRQ